MLGKYQIFLTGIGQGLCDRGHPIGLHSQKISDNPQTFPSIIWGELGLLFGEFDGMENVWSIWPIQTINQG